MNQTVNAIAVGRLVPIKNFDLILDAWTKISIPLQIVGDGPLLEGLVQQAERLDLMDRVKFLGERSDVPELMANSSLLVSSSSREGFSYVVLEALRARLVVVATSTGIAADLVPHKYLVAEPSSSSIASAVEATLTSFEQARLDFAPAWKDAEKLTVHQMIRATENVYKNTINEST